jgi:hypothetical protein
VGAALAQARDVTGSFKALLAGVDRLKIIGLQPSSFCDSREHFRSDLVPIVESENEVRPAITR